MIMNDRPAAARVVALGAPVTFRGRPGRARWVAAAAALARVAGGRIPQATLACLEAPLMGWIDGAVDYREAMRALRAPALIAGGADDAWAPPACLEGARALLGERAQIRVFGRAAGCSTDYGHADLIFGRRAPEEVFPVLASWLRDHATRAAS